MIKNERQYRVTKAQAGRFRQALIELKSSNRAPSLLRKAQTEAIGSQLEQLERQIEDYEQLKSGKHRELAYETFSEMLHGLTKARIARGLTQKALAQKIQLKEQQVQRYEATDYASASTRRVREVLRALGAHVRGSAVLTEKETHRRSLSATAGALGRTTNGAVRSAAISRKK